jgi:N-terminal acetyltransferase B complex non-catalytic subunit
MYKKRLKSVYDLLEAGNNKKVIQEVDKMISASASSSQSNKQSLKKAALNESNTGGANYDEEATLVIAKALKSLALLRTGKKPDAERLIDELLDSNTTDENALSVIMQYCKDTQQLHKIVSFYENAVNKSKQNTAMAGSHEHEEILVSLFYAYVRNRDFLKQQQVSLKLYRETGRMMFCFWNAATYAMLARIGNAVSVSNKSNDDEKQKSVYLQLAEKMLQKAYEEQKMEYNGEYLLYLNILEERNKYDEALRLVNDFNEEQNLSKIGQIDFRVKKKIEYYQKLKRWSDLEKLVRDHIATPSEVNMNDWTSYVYYLDSILGQMSLDEPQKNDLLINNALAYLSSLKKCSVDSAEDGIKNQNAAMGSSKASAPFLASIELLSRLIDYHKQNDKTSHMNETLELKLKENLADLIRAFNSKPGLFFDLMHFKGLLEIRELQEFILNELKILHDMNRPFKSVKSIYTCLIYWQMHRYFGKQERLAESESLELCVELERMYIEALDFGKELLSTGFQYADEFIIMSVHIRYDLYKRRMQATFTESEIDAKTTINNSSSSNSSSLSTYMFQLIVNLKQALIYSPSNYQLKLLLLNIYSQLGAYECIHAMYNSMEIKNIQNYSTGNMLLVHNIRLGALGSAYSTCANMDQFFTSNLFDMANFLVNCYKYGTFLKAFEICQFMDTVRQSLTLNLCLTNFMCMSFILHSVNLQSILTVDSANQIKNILQRTQNQQPLSVTSDDDFGLGEFMLLKSRLDQHLKELSSSSRIFDTNGLLPDDDQQLKAILLDHADKNVLYNWDSKEELAVTENQYESAIYEQRKLLKLRNLFIRYLDVCLRAWLQQAGDEKQQQNLAEIQNDLNSLKEKMMMYKNKLIEFDYVGSASVSKASHTNVREEFLNSLKQEDEYESKLKIYIPKSNYLKRWAQLNLNVILNTFVNLCTELCENDRFIAEQQENGQAELNAHVSSLKKSFESLVLKIDIILEPFENEQNATQLNVEFMNRIIECFSSSLECFSFVIILFTLSLSSKNLVTLWSEKLKKSKKKKGQYAQCAATVDKIYDIYEIVCQLINFYTVKLKEITSAKILKLTQSLFKNTNPTIMYTNSTATQPAIANSLTDISYSYVKSFEELTNVYNAKLKYLLKFAHNTNVKLATSIESLKIY